MRTLLAQLTLLLFLIVGCRAGVGSADATTDQAKTTGPQPRAVEQFSITATKTFEEAYGQGIALHPDGKTWFTSGGGTTRIWVDDEPAVLEGVPSVRSRLVLTPDGRTLYIDTHAVDLQTRASTPLPAPLYPERQGYEIDDAVASDDGQFLAYSVQFRPPRGIPTTGPDGEDTYRYAGPTEPDGPDRYLAVMALATGEVTIEAEGMTSRLALSRSYLTGQSLDAVLELRGDGKREVAFGGAAHFAFSADEQLLAAGSWEGDIAIHGLSDLQEVRRLDGTGDRLERLVFHPATDALFAGYQDGTLEVWDVHSGTLLASHKQEPFASPEEGGLYSERVTEIAFSEDGKTLAVGYGLSGEVVRFHDLTWR